MEYISAEEFLKQDIDIQIIFMEWWIPKLGDLFYTNEYGIEALLDKSENGILGTKEFYTSEKVIPLLTEGQLRKFIEGKINSKIEVVFVDKEGVENEESYYRIERVHYLNGNLKNSVWITGKSDLLQAYWKVALEVAKGCK